MCVGYLHHTRMYVYMRVCAACNSIHINMYATPHMYATYTTHACCCCAPRMQFT